MTDQDIFVIAHYFNISFTKLEDKDGYSYDGIEGCEKDFLNFAREIFKRGQQEEIRRQKTGIGYVNGTVILDEF
jgi:hypothetical protein